MRVPVKSAASPGTARRASRRLGLWAAGLAVAALVLGLGWAWARLGLSPDELVALAGERSPGSVLRYAERRLDGHDKLEALAQPLIGWARRRLEREPPPRLADLGKGQRLRATVPVRFDAQGRPQPAAWPLADAHPPRTTRRVSGVDPLRAALREAQAGDVIEIEPGRYELDRSLNTRMPGRPGQPIVLRAAIAGTVTLRSRTTEALVVSQPHWVIENLNWEGACKTDNGCEHAVHVVGRALGTVIVNNRMTDFNAHIKVNGDDGHWPDDGLLQFNTLTNTRTRRASRPIAPLDLVAASGWQVLDNHFEHFPRTDTRRPAYGLFFKGGGSGGRIERNVVICTREAVSSPGIRVGIGVGSGGTAERFCRDGRCTHEQSDTVVANNVVAHCNDVGIDVSNSTRVQVLHNTVVNTAGIGLRDAPADAVVRGNLLDGGLYARRGTRLQASDNVVGGLPQRLQDADALKLAWRQLPEPMPDLLPEARIDFCGRPRGPALPPGAFAGAPRC